MLSVKNRGISEGSSGGMDTSLVMMKSNPEFSVVVPVYSISYDGYSNTGRANGEPTEYIMENIGDRVKAIAKSFTCVQGYTQQTVNP